MIQAERQEKPSQRLPSWGMSLGSHSFFAGLLRSLEGNPGKNCWYKNNSLYQQCRGNNGDSSTQSSHKQL